MTQEEKAKAYDKVSKEVKDFFEGKQKMYNDVTQTLEHLFPELKESGDEKTRKSLISFLEELGTFGKDTNFDKWSKSDCATWICWLEKQGEQKPADLKTKAGNWYACNMEVVNENMVTAFHRDEVYYCPKDGYIDVGGALFEVGSLDIFRLATEKEIPQPKQEWTDDDEAHIDSLLKRLDGLCKNQFERTRFAINEDKDWLKSLRPQNTWKPSDYELEVLRLAAEKDGACLMGLYEQLLKLREE